MRRQLRDPRDPAQQWRIFAVFVVDYREAPFVLCAFGLGYGMDGGLSGM